MTLLQRPRIQILLVLLVTYLAYFNIFQNDLVFDDRTFLSNWTEVKNIQNLTTLVRDYSPADHKHVYRPVRGLLYTLSYNLWDQNFLAYHLISLLTHLSSTALVYLIALKIFNNSYLAFLTGLIFGVHPSHTESVAFMTAGMDHVGVVFFFLSFYLYLVWSENPKKKYLLISAILSFLASFTNEITFSLPALIILNDLTLGKIEIKEVVKKWKIYLIYFFPIFLYTLM